MDRIKKVISLINKPNRAAYFFILPSVLVLIIFCFIPLIASVVVSMTNMDIFLKNIKFIGLKNYMDLILDDRFWNALYNTFYFTIVEMPLQVILALLVAVYVQKNTGFRKFLRSAFFLPVVCSMTAIGILWSMLLDPSLGIYPYFLRTIGIANIGFLKDSIFAMPTIIFTTIWKNFGFSMILLVAGIQGIPSTYYEAAHLDGANKFHQFKNITIPLLIPTLSFCIITNTIGSIQVFDQAYVMTQGGPMFKTETLVQYIYYRGFKIAPYNLGYSSAIAEVLFVIIMIITLLMNRYFMKKETVEA